MSDAMVILRAVLGDIAELDVDCVVNAANTTLLGGGGVDGAIHEPGSSSMLSVRFGEAAHTGKRNYSLLAIVEPSNCLQNIE